MKRLRVLLLIHRDFLPPLSIEGLSPEEVAVFKTEFHVREALREVGHSVIELGLHDDLTPLRTAIREWKPHIAFNLLEEFQEQAIFDHSVVSYLELMRTPYTGCNPRGLLLARDKALSKKVLLYHNVKLPFFEVFPRGKRVRRPKHLSFPLIVKSLVEEASLGISQASVVTSDEKLLERVSFIHESVGTDAIVEQFVDGREITVSLLGTDRIQAFPAWELDISGMPEASQRIATRKVKWDLEYQKRYGIRLERAHGLTDALQSQLKNESRRIYRALGLSGYARLDFRLTPDHQFYFIEANANPDIAKDEEFACAARAAGISYPALIQKILSTGMRDCQELRQAS